MKLLKESSICSSLNDRKGVPSYSGFQREEYFTARRRGLDRQDKAMEAIFSDVILQTLRKRKA